jgi:hypothetical protein
MTSLQRSTIPFANHWEARFFAPESLRRRNPSFASVSSKIRAILPRALFGLSEALKAQGKSDAADSVRRLLSESWKNPDVALRIQNL